MIPCPRFVLPVVLTILLALSEQAGAEPSDTKPWIHLELSADLLEQHERDDLSNQLANAVGDRGFELALDDESLPGEPIAHIAITGGTGSVVAVRIEIADEVTTKTVSRSVELQTIPRDGWVLTLVLSADELLRASWAELLIEDAPEPKVAVPKEVVEAVEETIVQEVLEPILSWSLGAKGSLYSSSWLGLGLSARLGFFAGKRALIFGGFEWQRSPQYDSSNASTGTDLLLGELGFQVELGDYKNDFGIAAIAAVELGGLRFNTEANEGFDGDRVAKFVVIGEVGLSMWIDIARFLRPFAEIGLTIPIQGTEGLDEGETITKLGGVGGSFMLGVCFLFGR